MKTVFKNMKDPFETLKRKHMPKEEQGATEVKKDIQRERIKQYMTREINLHQNTEKAVAIVWGRCSSALQSYMKGLEDFEDNFDDFKIIWLLSELKKAVSGIDDKVNPHLNLHKAIAAPYKMKQYPAKANDHYLMRLKQTFTQ